MTVQIDNVIFESQEQLDFALEQFEKFGRCPHVYPVDDCIKKYIGSRWGKNSPLDKYWGSPTDQSYQWHPWLRKRYVIAVFSGDTDAEEILAFEQEKLFEVDAANNPNYLNKTNYASNGQLAQTEAARKANVKNHPDTNGVAPHAIKAWATAV